MTEGCAHPQRVKGAASGAGTARRLWPPPGWSLAPVLAILISPRAANGIGGHSKPGDVADRDVGQSNQKPAVPHVGGDPNKPGGPAGIARTNASAPIRTNTRADARTPQQVVPVACEARDGAEATGRQCARTRRRAASRSRPRRPTCSCQTRSPLPGSRTPGASSATVHGWRGTPR